MESEAYHVSFFCVIVLFLLRKNSPEDCTKISTISCKKTIALFF